MYVFAAVFAVVFVVFQTLADQQEESASAQVIEKCASDTGANLTAIFSADYQGNDPFFNCFFRCAFTRLGYVDENGNTNLTKYGEKFVFRGSGEEIAKMCTNFTAQENICDRVLGSQLCVLRNTVLDDDSELETS